jgi:type I restriction enzyme, S subunit
MCRQWVNQATVSREGLLALHLSVPPLEEQRRIAAILDQIDTLRAKRRQVLAHLDTLTQSIFHDMFGTRSYEARPFADVCERVTVGVVIRPASYYVDVGVPALRTLNVKPGRIVLDDLVYFSHESNDGPLAKSRLRSGDLVVTRTGNAGVTAVVPPALDGANAIDLIVASPDPRTVTSTFLECLLNSDLGKRIVSGEARGQIQQHFNVGSLKNAMIPVPPLDRQCDFASRVVEVNTQRVAVQRALAADDELFTSLQARAFRGEL